MRTYRLANAGTLLITTLGIKIDNFNVAAHTLPFSGPIDGLLGMDLLRKIKARIDLENSLIEIP